VLSYSGTISIGKGLSSYGVDGTAAVDAFTLATPTLKPLPPVSLTAAHRLGFDARRSGCGWSRSTSG